MIRASVVQVARLPFPAEDGGANPTSTLHVETATVTEINPLLASAHYLGPVSSARVCFAGWVADELVACQAWRWPTARMVPTDWLELSRWCLTLEAGENAGSRMMGYVRRWIRRNIPKVTALVSYSDPSRGHTGALYRASGWSYAPTHHGLRYDLDGVGYASGHGSWDGQTIQSPKHRWMIQFTDDTWGGYGGYQHAKDAPANVQNERARQVFAGGAGASNWYGDSCYAGG